MIFSKIDISMMAHALKLAERGKYYAHPNPMVGCVITDEEGSIIAEGYHEKYGGAHAEINALKKLNYQAKNTTIYISLEPCCYQGKTPACSNVIIQSGAKKVIIAMLDPNPKVKAKGVQQLKKAGIKVLLGLMEDAARALNFIFVYAMEEKMPFVRCKIAMSLDGKTAMKNGQSKWITGNNARIDVQKLRMSSDAILTGSGTVLADNPSLTVRLDGVKCAPMRLVIDSKAQISKQANIYHGQAETRIYTRQNAKTNAEGYIDLKALLKTLYQENIYHILLETGPRLIGAMLKENLIDEFIIYSAPLLLGSGANSAINLDLKMLNEAILLKITDVRFIADDIRITATPKKNNYFKKNDAPN